MGPGPPERSEERRKMGPELLFQATNPLLGLWKYQEIRTIEEQFEAEIVKKLRTAQPEPKVTGSYKRSMYRKYFSRF